MPLHTKIHLILLLLRQAGLVCVETAIYQFNNPTTCNPNQNSGGFFHHIKVCQRIGRTDSIQAVCRTMRRLETFLYLADQNFKLL